MAGEPTLDATTRAYSSSLDACSAGSCKVFRVAIVILPRALRNFDFAFLKKLGEISVCMYSTKRGDTPQ